MQMNIAKAKARLSELVAAAERGEDVVITRGGHPIVRLVLAGAKVSVFRLGIAEGEVVNIPDFLEPMAEDEIAPWT